MRIAICDDEACFVETIYQYLWDEQHCTIDTYLNPEQLLAQYESGVFYDIIFCDILMEPINGIELARKIRTFDENVILVYLSSNLDYAPLGYEVRAFRYLLKPIQKESLHSVMNDIYQEQKIQNKLLFETPYGSILIPENSIQYIEVSDKEVEIFYDNDSLCIKKGLNELESTLTSPYFFRIHRKYMVHLNHVTEYDNTKVTMDCSKTLPISRRKSKEFRETMNCFIKGEKL